MDRRRIGIVIPAYNESRTIESVVLGTKAYGLPIVVDDASIDRTSDIARSAGADVVRHDANGGYDQALNSGCAYASSVGCDCIITMDADGQHNPAQITAFIAKLDSGADAVVGIRDRKQRCAEILFGLMTTVLWGIHDPLCGMKGYRISLYRELGHFDSYRSIGTELLLFAAKRGKKIVEVPVKTRDRADSPRFGSTLSANWRILKAMTKGLVPR
jgi:glycosyltransferase involved in cell wall biosynthesis